MAVTTNVPNIPRAQHRKRKVVKRANPASKPITSTQLDHHHSPNGLYAFQGPITPLQRYILDKIFFEVTAYPEMELLEILAEAIHRTPTQVANWFSNKRSPPKVSLKKDETGRAQHRKFDVGEHKLYSFPGSPGRKHRLRPKAAYLGAGNPASARDLFEMVVLVVKTRALMRLAV